jgi:hypothetical protein
LFFHFQPEILQDASDQVAKSKKQINKQTGNRLSFSFHCIVDDKNVSFENRQQKQQ